MVDSKKNKDQKLLIQTTKMVDSKTKWLIQKQKMVESQKHKMADSTTMAGSKTQTMVASKTKVVDANTKKQNVVDSTITKWLSQQQKWLIQKAKIGW